jgi:general secretion pathway protein I
MISRKRRAEWKSAGGFTLIEVLVALSVVAISFVALYGVILQMVGATTLMQEKTIASWIAFDRVTELRLSKEFPGTGNSEGEIEMANGIWIYRTEIKATDSEDIRQVIVSVAPESEPGRTLGLVSGALVRNEPSAGGPDVPADFDPGRQADDDEGDLQ